MKRMSDLSYIFRLAKEFKTGLAPYYPLIYSIVVGLETKYAFEFGTGASTGVILDALKETEGKLISCSTDPVRKVFESFSDENKKLEHLNWTHFPVVSDEALQTIPEEIKFDFVLHDGSHSADVVERDLLQIVPRMKEYGVLLIHDVLHSYSGEGMIRGIKEGMEKAIDYRNFNDVTLPYAYGLGIITVHGKLNKKNGRVQVTRNKQGSEHTTDLGLL